ncbi:MAG: 16S rRNA (guanine(527)-N(7))-methyltransferase RsmG [Betaproteobacteria bacterium]
MTPQAALERGLSELPLPLPRAARQQLLQYVALLAKWNRTYNLTAIRTQSEMVSHHLLDSLAILPHLPMPEADPALADAGSGPGLPGIPLALARPAWRVTLVESSAKKIAFLRQATIELGLRNVALEQARVEQWRPAARFAVVVSRAFAGLAQFIAACRHLVAPHGVLAAMKGRDPRSEMARLPRGCECEPIRLSVPLLDAERHLVLCRLAHCP